LYRAQEQLELIHGDLCGPVTPTTPGGQRYFLLLVDDTSRFMWAVLLLTKGAAVDAIKQVQAAVEKESSHKLWVLRIDNGGEFTAAEFSAYCANEGIQRHFSLYSPQQNGDVEHRNQTVVVTARALLKQRGMLTKYWAEAVINRSPIKSLEGKTPYESWHGCSPTIGDLPTFGCIAYAKEMNQVGKLGDRSKPNVFIGYAEGVKAYRILNPVSQHVRVARDVVFDEGRGWDWSKVDLGGSAPATSDFVIEYKCPGEAGGAQSASLAVSGPSSPTSSTPPPMLHSPSPNPGEPGASSAAAPLL
jgi:hypothetical protein